MTTLTTRRCAGCGEEKPPAAFNSRRCRDCQTAMDRLRPDRGSGPAQRERNLKRAHGITVTEYNVMLAAQGGVCASCGFPPRPDPTHPDLVVDHDHRTGRRRGLICNDCNLGISRFADDPDRLRAAALYLETH